jgi:hypothetical protein
LQVESAERARFTASLDIDEKNPFLSEMNFGIRGENGNLNSSQLAAGTRRDERNRSLTFKQKKGIAFGAHVANMRATVDWAAQNINSNSNGRTAWRGQRSREKHCSSPARRVALVSRSPGAARAAEGLGPLREEDLQPRASAGAFGALAARRTPHA